MKDFEKNKRQADGWWFDPKPWEKGLSFKETTEERKVPFSVQGQCVRQGKNKHLTF